MLTANKHYQTLGLYTILSLLLYIAFAYDLNRSNSIKLISLYFALFVPFYKITQGNVTDFKFLAGIAILFRLVFLWAIPNLSQDFYRFIWDGRLILEGINPYLFTPEALMGNGHLIVAQAQELYEGMGPLSASHYTNYPPVKQFFFMIAAFFSKKSIFGAVLTFRIFIIMADIGILFIGKKLLEHLQLPVHSIFWYFLNPFVIIELTGNLHFEAIMIFFLLLGLYLLHKGLWKTAAVAIALSISIKLIPLLLLPLFVQYFVLSQKTNEKSLNSNTFFISKAGLLKLIGFYGIIGGVLVMGFAPFYAAGLVDNYSKTTSLWFNNFEFNASLYYLARQIGYALTGYNQIAQIGQFIPILTGLAVVGLAVFRKNNTIKQLIVNMLFALTFYYFVSTTVHPWYLAMPLILMVFTNYRFPLVWSCAIILSYLAYSNVDTAENLWVIGLEYGVVYLVFLWELVIKNRAKTKRAATFSR